MFKDAPTSYKDPFWSNLAAQAANEFGVPTDVLKNILLKGERSNADQVSSAGARTPFQIIPKTRQGIIKNYGFDPYASPKDSARGAAVLIKESLDRNKGDIRKAVQEYHGGLDPKGYGPVNDAYVDRVTGMQGESLENDSVAELLRLYNERTRGAGGKIQSNGDSEDNVSKLLSMYNVNKNKSLPEPIAEKDRENLIGQIPKDTSNPATRNLGPAPREKPRALDVLEGVLSMATAPAGLVGGAVGVIDALPQAIFGKGDFAKTIAQGAKAGFDAGTYSPSTEAGRQVAENIGDFISKDLKIPAVLPIIGPTGALAPIVAAQRPIQQAGQVSAKASAAAKATPDMLKKLSSRAQESLASMDKFAKRQGAAGAQGVEMETLRRGAANELPVPMGQSLTKGQATRDFEQTRFERETAKDAERGKPLRDRYSEQNKKLLMNMDSFIDQTGAETTSKIQTGKVITKALMDRAQTDKVKINDLYKIAEQSPESMQPIKIDSVFEYINNNRAEAAVSPALKFAKSKAIELGMATEAPDGRLIGRPITLIEGERLRKAIGAATGNDAPDIRQSSILKGLYDADTESAGGALYKAARRARENYAKRFENRAVIADLLETKRNSDDRRVALEDVQSRIIDKGSREDLSILMGILDNSGEQGKQALRELRGASLMKIKANATKSANSDEMGNPIISADKLNSSIRQLDEDGKLDRLYGKKGAEQLRTLADVAKVVLTVPAGTVNYSNTASVLAGLTDVALTGFAGGIPVPLATSGRLLINKIKDKRIQAKINDALGKKQSKENK
jgi:hypothetical protein